MTNSTGAPRPSSMGADFLWTSAGNIFFAACQWAQVLILARAGGAESAGLYAIGMATASPVVMFATLSLRPVLAADVARRFSFADYLGLRVSMLASAFLVVLALVSFHGESASRAATLWVGLALCFEYISDIYYAESQRRERLDLCAVGLFLKGAVSIGALAAGILLARSVLWACAALAAARLATLVFYDLRLAGPLVAPRLRYAAMRSLLKTSAPLGATLMLGALYLNVPRYFISAWAGNRELGVFAALASLSMAGNFFVTALGQAGLVRMAKAWTACDFRAFSRLLALLFAMTIALAVGGVGVAVVGGRPLLSFLLGPDYAPYSSLFTWLAVAGGCGYAFSLMGNVLLSIRCYAPQVPLLATSTAVAAAGCALWMPAHGVYGAAVALIVSALVYIVSACGIVLSRAREQKARSSAAPALAVSRAAEAAS